MRARIALAILLFALVISLFWCYKLYAHRELLLGNKLHSPPAQEVTNYFLSTIKIDSSYYARLSIRNSYPKDGDILITEEHIIALFTRQDELEKYLLGKKGDFDLYFCSSCFHENPEHEQVEKIYVNKAFMQFLESNNIRYTFNTAG